MRMRKFILTVITCAVLKTVAGQDPNFSQFFVSPLTLNPAMTGKFNGDFRIAGNYRDQWPAISKAFVTTTASFDMPILRNRISELDTWGVGVVAMADKTANGILNTNLISVTTAYHKGIDEDGKVLGEFSATGYVPKCFEDFLTRGLAIDTGLARTECLASVDVLRADQLLQGGVSGAPRLEPPRCGRRTASRPRRRPLWRYAPRRLRSSSRRLAR